MPYTFENTSEIDDNLPVFRLGFDYVFDAETGRPFCVEINGRQSGDGGLRQFDEAAADNYARTNLWYNRRIEAIVGSKIDQHPFIPPEARPRIQKIITPRSHDDFSDLAPDKKWVLKPDSGNKGNGVIIGSPDKIETAAALAKRQSAFYSKAELLTLTPTAFLLPIAFGANPIPASITALVLTALAESTLTQSDTHLFRRIKRRRRNLVQEFVPPSPADLSETNGPACLRHLMVGKINQATGTILIDHESVCQRVQPLAETPEAQGYVINTSYEAKPINASEREQGAVTTLSRRITSQILEATYPACR